MKRWAIIIVAILAVIGGFLYLTPRANVSADSVQLNGHEYHATVLRTEAELIKGLSGTKSLPADRAVVFVFPSDDKWAIWMKDMNYPIDIIWLDKTSRVVGVVADAQPSSYPKTQYRPPVEARYVIELASGTIKKTGIKSGDSVRMPSGV